MEDFKSELIALCKKHGVKIDLPEVYVCNDFGDEILADCPAIFVKDRQELNLLEIMDDVNAKNI